VDCLLPLQAIQVSEIFIPTVQISQTLRFLVPRIEDLVFGFLPFSFRLRLRGMIART
jgi:hypothetical protein